MTDLKYDPVEAIQRGMPLLDQMTPGWLDRVKENRIDLTSSNSCVLGQVFEGKGTSGYYRGRSFLWDRLSEFDIALPPGFGSNRGDFPGLLYLTDGGADAMMAWYGFWAPGDYTVYAKSVRTLLENSLHVHRHTIRWRKAIKARREHDAQLSGLGAEFFRVN